MIKTALAATAALTLTTGTAMADTRAYDLDPFNRIDIATGLYAVVTRGDSQSVIVETGKDGLIDKIDISVSHGKLRAKFESNLLDIILSGGLLNMLDHGHGATIYITVPDLAGVESASGADVKVDTLSGESVAVNVSSGGHASIDTVDAHTLVLNASSGGNVALSGLCETLEVNFSSGGHIMASHLSCGDVSVSGSSGASASFGADGDVSGKVSSGANLRLGGNPASVHVESSSGGGVSLN